MKHIIPAALLAVLAVLLVGQFFAIRFDTCFDVPALLLAPVFGTLYAGVVRGFKNSGKACKAPFAASATDGELKQALSFFKTLERSQLCFGIIWAIANVINMLRNSEDAADIAVRLTLACTGILYVFAARTLWIVPCKALIRKRIGGEE
jgi:hypothetical protein